MGCCDGKPPMLASLEAREEFRKAFREIPRPRQTRKSCIECVEKHIGAAMVLESEMGKGYRHHFLALHHLKEAERMMRMEKPELADEIARQREAFASRGQQADWCGVSMALSLVRGADDPDEYMRRLIAIGHLHEAEEEAAADYPDLAVVIREARKAYQSDGTEPDTVALTEGLENEMKG